MLKDGPICLSRVPESNAGRFFLIAWPILMGLGFGESGCPRGTTSLTHKGPATPAPNHTCIMYTPQYFISMYPFPVPPSGPEELLGTPSLLVATTTTTLLERDGRGKQLDNINWLNRVKQRDSLQHNGTKMTTTQQRQRRNRMKRKPPRGGRASREAGSRQEGSSTTDLCSFDTDRQINKVNQSYPVVSSSPSQVPSASVPTPTTQGGG